MFTKKQYSIPTQYPAAVTFRTDATNSTELMVANQDAYAAFARNVGGLDAGKIMARKSASNEPFTAEDFAQSLKEGATFRGELENDGPTCTCGLCLSEFQPKVIPYSNADGSKGEGGNFLILKTAQVAALVAKIGELGTRVSDIANSTTASIMGAPAELKAVALPVCPKCRESRKRAGFMERFYSRKSAAEMLPTVDQKISVAANRSAISEALGGFQPNRGGHERHAASSGAAFRRPGNNDRRPDKPKRSWHGAMLELATADAFEKSGLTSIADALALSEEAMCERGLAHAGSVKAIRFVLGRASEGRTVVGSASPAATAPGAVPSKKKVTGGKRTKTITVTSGAPTRGTKLDQLV